MEISSKLGHLWLLLAGSTVLATAHIMEYDEYWLQREAIARKLSKEAYHSNPKEITAELNEHVNMAIERLNSTRRHLTGNSGSCTATNPIDRCWRCRSNWEKERKRLARCVNGFGRPVTQKPGTLSHAVIQKRPLWLPTW